MYIMKKHLSLLLALAIVMTMCVGTVALADDSYFNQDGYPICDDPITITVSGSASNWGEAWNDTVMVEEIANRFGIIMDCNEQEEWETQFTLMLASDDLPDLVISTKLDLNQIADYGSQGYFLPLNDLIDEYAPNLKSLMEEYPMLEAYMTSPDGNIYTLLGFADNTIEQVPRVFMSKQWLENLGLDYPETLDDFYNMLVAFKTQDANGNGDPDDEIPLAFGASNFVENIILSAFGFRSRESKYILQVDDNGQIYLGETSDNYKAYITFMHQLYEEGLLDAKTYIGTSDEHDQDVIDDRVGVFGAWAPFVTTGKGIDGDAAFDYLGALSSDYSPQATLVLSSQIGNTALAVINSNTEYPEAIVRLLDYFYSDEGIIAAMRGWEDVTFDYVTLPYEGLESYPIATVREAEGYASAEEYRYKKAVINTGFLFVTSSLATQYAAIEAATDEQLEAMLPDYGWAVLIARDALNNPNIELVSNFPTLIYNEEESTQRSTYYTDISLYIESMKAQFITGEVDIETGWDTFISTLNQMGLQDLLAIEQSAYDRLFK